jgi:hypothetical protein
LLKRGRATRTPTSFPRICTSDVVPEPERELIQAEAAAPDRLSCSCRTASTAGTTVVVVGMGEDGEGGGLAASLFATLEAEAKYD